jgi:hypothetical protein
MFINSVTATIATFFIALGGWMQPSQDKTFTTYGYIDHLDAPASARVGHPLVIKVSGALPQAGLTFRGLEFVEYPETKTILIKAVATGEKDKAYADMLSPFTATGSFTPRVTGLYRFTAMQPNGTAASIDKRLEVRP